MMISKILALALFVTSSAMARIQLESTISVSNENEKKQYQRTIASEIQLDAHTSSVIVDTHDLRIETNIVAETESGVVVQYSIRLKNTQENYKPILCANYRENATVSFGQKTKDSEHSEIITLTLKAHKIS